MKFEDYKTICFSTAHITYDDSVLLGEMADQELGTVAIRSTGYFVKVLQPNYVNMEIYGHMPSLYQLVIIAINNGYECIELDRDAKTYDNLPTFNW